MYANWNSVNENSSEYKTYGGNISNFKELGNNHIGDKVLLWKTKPDSLNNKGGINAAYKNIDKTKTYRLSVWIKKTNSNDGTTYFGCFSKKGESYQTQNLNGTLNNDPYFWYGDLPKLDRWYLLVGYVHHSKYTGSILGGIYDGVTGKAIKSDLTDFKFSDNANNLMLRSFLSNDSNEKDSQFLYNPRMELVNGKEPNINELLKINPDSQLLFAYDEAGNQNQFFYCVDKKECKIPTPPYDKIEEPDANDNITETNIDLDIYPNPTNKIVSIKLPKEEALTIVNNISIYSVHGTLVQSVDSKDKSIIKVDIAQLSVGTYFVHFHLSNGKSVTKQIIKK